MMKNLNTKPILSFEEKHLCDIKGFYHPMRVSSYDEFSDTFTIENDGRYAHDGRDTAYYDLDDFTIPAVAIYALTGADTDFDDPHDWVGHLFLMPGNGNCKGE